jgi:hypothetical protein
MQHLYKYNSNKRADYETLAICRTLATTRAAFRIGSAIDRSSTQRATRN